MIIEKICYAEEEESKFSYCFVNMPQVDGMVEIDEEYVA